MHTSKLDLLQKLYTAYNNCVACPLGKLGRTQVVFGEGNPNATLMLIGEGPGQDEDRQGRPFVGRSGKLLTKMLDAIGIEREQDVYITNIVKCRPPNNRKPSPLENNTCKNLLLVHQLKIIKPQVICTLGASALEGLLNRHDIKITQMRGIPIETKGVTIIPTLHPAYVLRNPAALHTMIQDLEKAWDIVSNR